MRIDGIPTSPPKPSLEHGAASRCGRSGSTTCTTLHATFLLREKVPIKVVSERLGHSTPAFTMATYQHVLPGMQDDGAARTFATILTNGHSVATGRNSVEALIA